MIRPGQLILAGSIAVILAFGTLSILKKNLSVAPWTLTAAEGRLHYHTKNTSRILGSPEIIYESLARLSPGEATRPSAPFNKKMTWQDTLRSLVEVRGKPSHIVALAGDGKDAAVWALPGAYWAAYAGVPIVFLGYSKAETGVLNAVEHYKVPVYVLAPKSLVSDDVLDQLSAVIKTRRVARSELASHAVAVAEYKDHATGFGWGRTHARRSGYFQYVVATPSEAGHALAALPLARSNAAAFLFTNKRGGLPPATDRYLWSQKADFFVNPSEGPFRHAWIIGDRTSYAAQARIDLALEKSPYASYGTVALGGMEALFIVFIMFGIAGGIFVMLHGARLLPEVMPHMRIAWAFTALFVPVLGVILYLSSYHKRSMVQRGEVITWPRPPLLMSASATAMGFGYGSPLMVAIGYLFGVFGFPLLFGPWIDSELFPLGAGMSLMMAGMYSGAILIAWLVVKVPSMQERGERRALGTTILSMSAVSLGMMPVAWLMMMKKAPMMPHEDEVLFFGSLWLASTVGFLVAWPLNWLMVRYKTKSGAM